jgi:hypothetical protein
MGRLTIPAALVLAALHGSTSADESPDTFFELKIRPVLAAECLPCHGGEKTQSGLVVASREALLKGGDRGPAIVPGDAEGSLLVQAIRRKHEDVKMPPKRHLPAGVVADLTRWVSDGAPWPDGGFRAHASHAQATTRHWAFDRLKVVEPHPDPTGWSHAPVDRFISARRRTAGLGPVGHADRRTLLRRVTFDLIGLPPTPEEIEQFLCDDTPLSFLRVVDRLLASPHYGERWGRHWMDVVRYADTAGDNADYPVPEVSRYRDYVIDSFNKDKPYDRFVREQLAGDILARRESPAGYAEPVVATGFLALSRRYGTGPFELWHLTLEDAIETTGRAFMGLTLRCARCHDHKFDPISQRDYYGLYGIFASTTFPWAGSEETQSKGFPRMNFVPLIAPGRAAPKLKAYQQRLADLERALAALPSTKDAGEQRRRGALKVEWSRLKRTALPLDVPGAYAVTEGKPADVPVQRRGDPASPGPVVPHGVPQFAFLAGEPPPPISPASSGRLELASWLTRPDHPLTARVMVNRMWQYHFGRGLVATPSNFGTRGAPPTHPELLDWLAQRFIQSGWSIKAMHREIVPSETYRLGSAYDEGAGGLDPEDRWLWRFPRRRLDAESIRDAMLAVSGRLDRNRPGGHPFPPIEDWHWTQHDAFKAAYPTSHRSVYLMTQRLLKHPYLAIFDGPDTNSSTDVRARSTVPLQALFLMNNPFVVECAEGFSRRLIAAAERPEARIALGYELAWGRPPTGAEVGRALEFVSQASAVAPGDASPRADADRQAWTSLARILLTANEFLYID